MARALTSTLALLLAAGIGFVGPELVEPEPVTQLWSPSPTDRTEQAVSPASSSGTPTGLVAATGSAARRGHLDHPSVGMLATATAVRASTLSSSRPGGADRTLLLSAATTPRTERPWSCSTP